MGFGMAEGGEGGGGVTRREVGAVGGVEVGWAALVGGGGVETRAELVAFGWERFGGGFPSPMELASGRSSLSGD